MPDPLDARAKGVFTEAVELQGPARKGLLDSVGAVDPELRARVEELLRCAESADPFLSAPTAPFPAPTKIGDTTEQPGAHIGPYRILELIGEGGFGSVYMAEQTHPVRRRVALKIIKQGMDTRAVVARFEQERQALALMDHPNIARVFDAGASATGRPFFVMELVKGEPITAFCDRANLSVPERLGLFAQNCRAVQHAHTKGVIHRDIKPTNVLVSPHDGRPFCKIIDFGIAKATLQPLTDKTVFTEFKQLVGTPEYMSPEQAAGSLDIDTRTDVYSLGVLLYELLTGATPFDPHELRSAAYGEIQRIIREVDPPAPSTRLSQRLDRLASLAAQRGTEPRKLGEMVRGELDWIVMRALEKDRARRYESPGNLAADVERFLAGEAVQAAPPSVTYRIRKLIHRHRAGVTAAGIVLFTLLLGLGAALWQARIASHERDLAKGAAAEALAARNDAESRRKEIEQVAQFQAAELRGIDPETMGRRLRDDLLAEARLGMERQRIPVDQIEQKQAQLSRLLADANPTNVALKTLDENIFIRALNAVAEQFEAQPLVKARLLQSLADAMIDLGLLDRATAPQSEALAIRRKLLGDTGADTLYSLNRMGVLLQAQGRLTDAEMCLREAVREMPLVFGENSREALGASDTLGVVLQLQGKLAEAEPFHRASLERLRRTLGPDHLDTIASTNNMGFLLFGLGKMSEAETCFRDALERLRRVQGNDDSDALAALNNLASIIQRQGRLDEAGSMFRDGLERSRRTKGEDHPQTLQFANNMGFLLYLQGRLAESEPYTRDTLEKRRRLLGADHWDTLQSINNLGLLLQAQGKLRDAEPYFQEALERRRRVLGENHQATLQSIHYLGVLLRDEGRLAEAESLIVNALEKRRHTLGNAHPDTLESVNDMGVLRLANGRPEDAEPLFREALAGHEVAFGKASLAATESRVRLAETLTMLGNFAEAESALLDAEHILAAARGAPPVRHVKCIEDLVALYKKWESSSTGKGQAASAAEWTEKLGKLQAAAPVTRPDASK